MTCAFCRACGVEESLLPPNFKCANEKAISSALWAACREPYPSALPAPQRIACSSTKNTCLPVSPVNTMWIACSIGSPLTVLTAIDREKQLKGWRRSKKIALSECLNPHWLDLSRGWYSQMKDGGASRDASTPSARSQATGLPTLSHDTSPRKITPTQHPCVRSEPHPVILCGAEESLPPRRTSCPPALSPFSSALNGITVLSTVSPQQPHSGIFTLVALCLTLPADSCHSDHDRRRRLQGNR
jgi:hypothetical protein